MRSGEREVNVYFPGDNTLWYEIETYKVYEAPGYQSIPVSIEKVKRCFSSVKLTELYLVCFINFIDPYFPTRRIHCSKERTRKASFLFDVKRSLYINCNVGQKGKMNEF